MHFQSQEAEEWEEGERKEQELRYLPRNWDTHVLSKLECIFHPSLAIRARFTSFIFLRPKPPMAFGRHIESQDLRVRFLVFFGEKPHKKFLKGFV
jgi:hypothetical protein